MNTLLKLRPSVYAGTLRAALLGAAALGLSACATVQSPPPEHDPWERYNRSMYAFNDSVDRAVLKPVAEFYDAYVPGFISTGISNFFSNLDDFIVTINDALQLKGRQTVVDGTRFILNSTIGIYGLFDVAGALGLEKNNEDFGQTLGYWGVPTGPYLVLPLLGSSTLRDGPALIVDAQYDLMEDIDKEYGDARYYQAQILRIVDTRARFLSASALLETAALDPYAFTRDAWLQRRRSQVHDGNPPPQPGAIDELDAFDDPAAGDGGDLLDELDQLDELDRLDQLDELDRLEALEAADENPVAEPDELDRLEAVPAAD